MVFTVLHYIVFIRVNVRVNKRVVIVIILVMLSLVTYHLGVLKKRNPKMSSCVLQYTYLDSYPLG